MINEKRLEQQLRTFERILLSYKFEEPLSRFLTSYYKQNRQMGSNDRRVASRLLYNYFRLGKGLQDLSILTRLAISEFLCTSSSDFIALIEPKLIPYIEESLDKKLSYLEKEYKFSINTVFPLIDKVSNMIDLDRFILGHFKQPDLFIRIHSGQEETVKRALKENGIDYNEISKNSLSFVNGSQLDKIKSIQGKYEVQDLSSQKTGNLFKAVDSESWWDACAGSGGKSILLKQLHSGVKLLVSDSRNTILRNLDSRLANSNITEYRRKIIDLTKNPVSVLSNELFDGIILDIPCSGSGTWGRSPEGMTSFSEEKLKYYSDLQRQIIENVIKHIRPGKPLIYITCSIYKQENEDQVAFLETKGFKLEEMTYFEGTADRADTLFAARLVAI
ncbi:RsmB/NOP family class I SAM-dependent RNA methyltransferase [Albibacterium bauzanense]|uniref:16S rRNA (Cytosine967-C5)-methyltransferase n=1 Tax=Albibacterium bauzanense TaxID=653929 RepID=A0A4R1LVU3_9SPHI|nr:RsmB/NOP family class I SAM-dependent RNA methyltransferase [Albibacterium bauzanense]TCK83556.1 16S rRNA (cytosine967-C5)-methyltransferase [Albibacterium bauzanense]